MAHNVKCFNCGEIFDRDKISFIQNGRRYAHQNCEQQPQEKNKVKKAKEQMTERESLIDFIYRRVYHKTGYEGAKISLLIDRYKEKYNFSYSGMEKTLEWLERNGFSMDPSIMSLLPYKYEEVFNLYKDIYEVQDINVKKIKEYIPTEKIVTISIPQNDVKKLPFFNMEDD